MPGESTLGSHGFLRTVVRFSGYHWVTVFSDIPSIGGGGLQRPVGRC